MKPTTRIILTLLGAAALAWGARQLSPTDAAASEAYLGGQKDLSAALFVQASAQEPDVPERIYNAGAAQISVDDEEAAALLERAIALGDEGVALKASYNAGVAYFQAGDYFAAVEAFRAVLVKNPNDADARYNYELALRYALPPTPSTQQQQTNPDEGQTDPTITPSPEPGGFDGPTPTPPRAEFEPDPTETPVGGTGDFGDDAQSTPVRVEGGPLTIEEALRLLDAAAQDSLTIAPFYATAVPGDEVGGNDW